MKNFYSGWYLLYTKPRHEKKVHLHMNELAIDSFLPVKKTLRTWHDRRKYVDEPLFPSYVFIYLKDVNSYYQGMDADGSLYFVRYGKDLARVNETIVNNIRIATSQVKDIEISEDQFKPGQQLVINQGALAGLYCELVQCDARQKLLIRVDLLQRSILLSLPQEHLMCVQ